MDDGADAVRELLDRLAAAAVDLEWHDLSTVLPVAAAFDDVARIEGDQPTMTYARDIGRWGAEAINAVFGQPDLDVDALGRQVQGAVAALESLLVDGRTPQDASFSEVSPPGPDRPGAERGSDESGELMSPEVLGLGEHVDAQLLSEFIDRLDGALNDIEPRLMAWEERRDSQARNEARGLVHTIKGEAGALGVDDIERLTHQMEEILQGADVPEGGVDSLFAAIDWMRAFVDYSCGRRPARPANLDVLLGQLCGEDGEPVAAAQHIPTESLTHDDDDEGLEFCRDPQELAEFLAEVDEHLEAGDVCLLSLEGGHHDEETLNTLFRAFHTIKGLAGFFGAHVIKRLAHEAEHLLDQARTGVVQMRGRCVDVVFEAIDLIRQQAEDMRTFVETGTKPTRRVDLVGFAARIHQLIEQRDDEEDDDGGLPDARSLTTTLVGSGRITQQQITAALTRRGLIVDEGQDASTVVKALVEDKVLTAREAVQGLREARQQPAAGAAVRESSKVDAERLDQLIDMIGEMVIAQSMVAQSPELRDLRSPQLLSRLTQLDKLTRGLQEMGTGLRMVPIRATFQRMARLARDLARKLNRPIDFISQGEDTELDKNVVDKIGDPLVHMVRNALDHGLEPDAAARSAAGKPAKGRVSLRAFHKGGSIYIEVEDDGKGLNRERILAKARDRKLIGPDEEPADRDLWQLIFHPGFSTAAQVTEVSGRGVGMDVVKRAIEALRGQVEIVSQEGRGTCFSIRLPLTLAVIDGMVVRLGRERYIIPTLSVVTSLRPGPEAVNSCLRRGEMLRWQEHLLPLHRLSRLFAADDAIDDPQQALCVVVEEDGKQVAVMVDELLGQQQVVIKTLGAGLGDVPGLSGGAIMGDGQVGLILDVAGLVRLAQERDL